VLQKGTVLAVSIRSISRLAIVALIGTALAFTLLVALPSAPAEAGASGAGSPTVAKRLRAKTFTAKLSGKRAHAVRVALAQRGDRYQYGATGPHAFDCSGLTSYAWRKAGIRIPRTSTAQRHWTRAVARSKKLPGDLLLYSGHAAMYVGFSGGKYWMMEASGRGKPVRLVPMRTRGLLKIGRVRT
jgi:cell wall-associated NlpC family hydrolase